MNFHAPPAFLPYAIFPCVDPQCGQYVIEIARMCACVPCGPTSKLVMVAMDGHMRGVYIFWVFRTESYKSQLSKDKLEGLTANG